MKPLSQCVAVVAVLLILALPAHARPGAAPDASARDYPVRVVRMIVPFGAGGASDFAARILQPKLTEALGQQVVVDNRVGAEGNIAVEIAARAAPDGYTMLLGHVSPMTINPSVYPKFPYRPARDLIGITLVTDLPGAMAAHPSVPAANVPEFVEYARSRPGKLNFGSAGPASPSTLAFGFLMRKSGIKVVEVPYKGGAGAATIAVLSGEVAVTMATVASFIPHVKSGKLKVLAVISPKRAAQLPGTPTMAESGFPELVTGSWQGLYLPAGTPPAIVKKLHSIIVKVMADPWVVERLASGGAEVLTSKSPAELAAFMKSQTEFWAAIVKDLGVAVN
ncbi:MAG: tripartite tricarboxylate transporter substrate binding protein [Burkholderiales bacterium]|nr:tripartite tricarboxylate transporter substrate binding protein [Burkholderiales bacterium]